MNYVVLRKHRTLISTEPLWNSQIKCIFTQFNGTPYGSSTSLTCLRGELSKQGGSVCSYSLEEDCTSLYLQTYLNMVSHLVAAFWICTEGASPFYLSKYYERWVIPSSSL